MSARFRGLAVLTVAAALAWSPAPAARQNAAAALNIPVEYHTLTNGLKVVLSRDTTTPTAVVGVYYNIGFRIEPKDRTGFAHLFEHMMFQGSQNLGKNAFSKLVESNGGVLNGSTRFDFTNYFEIIPRQTLETVLWAEADRMRGLDITQDNLTNQQGVVKNEVKVNVLNQPYGGFPWLDLPQFANTNWYNAHNFYGDLEHLDAATLADVRQFFKTYYTPEQRRAGGERRLRPGADAGVGAASTSAAFRRRRGQPQPDITEPRQEKERRDQQGRPARDPSGARARLPRARAAHARVLRDGPDRSAAASRAATAGSTRRWSRKKGLTGGVSGGINEDLGNMFDIKGPSLWALSAHPRCRQVAGRDPQGHRRGGGEAAVHAGVEGGRSIARWSSSAPGSMRNTRAQVGFGRANLLAAFALFDDDPGRINRLDDAFRKVTPELIQKTAQRVPAPDQSHDPDDHAEGRRTWRQGLLRIR